MKFHKFLLLFVAFHLAAGAAYAQSITIELNNVPMKEAFQEIKEKTGYKFFFAKDVVDPEQAVSISVQNGTIDDVVKQLLSGLQVEYIIQKKQILLKPAASDESDTPEDDQQLDNNSANSGKTKVVSGHVVSESGESLPGVNIWQKGTNTGAITDVNGDYRLRAVEGNILIFSFIGFENMEVLVGSKDHYNVKLKENITQLGEVEIASSGYEKIPKERATGSYKTVSAEQIQDVPTINVLERLEGRVAGVNVDVKNNTISIRGRNSYNTSAPLVVIDGFPMPQEDFSFTESKPFQGSATLSFLNPNTIESITFLKDAAATSIWGSRAANGVIVITTKNGTGTKEPSVSFSSTVSVGDRPYLNKLNQMNSAQYVDLEKEMVDLGFLQDHISDWTAANPSEAQEWMYKVNRGTATTDERDAALAELSSRNNTHQIEKYLMQNSLSQQYNMSVSGGSEKNTYFISGTFNKDQPVMKGNKSQSYNFTFNNTINLFNDWVKLSTGINYISALYTVNNTVNEAMSTVSSTGLRPYDMLVDENGKSIDKYILFRPEVIQNFESEGYMDWTYNYLNQLNYSNVVTKSNTVRMNGKLESNITNWLNLSLSGMYYKLTNEQSNMNELESYFTRNLINTATYYDSYSGELTYGIPVGAYYTINPTVNESYDLRSQLSVNKRFNENHQLNMIAVAEIRQEKRSSYGKTFYGYNQDTNAGQTVNPTDYYTTVYGWSTFIGGYDNSYSKYRNRYLSYVTSGTYSFKNRYFLSGSMRFDDYNLLGANRRNRAIPLWSTGVRWKILDEPFITAPKFLSHLDLRVTYGKGGSTPTGGLGNNNAVINLGTDYYTGLTNASISTPANAQLKWETTKTLNYGLDFGFFQEKIRGSIEYYTKKSYDILMALPFNATYGITSLTYNAGTLSGHGIDLDLSVQILDGNFKWNSAINLAYNTNKVTHSSFEATSVSDYTAGSLIKGKPIGAIYGYRWAGLDNQGRSQIHDKSGELISSDVYSTDIDPKSMKYMGTTTAPYFGGWFNTFSWKNFDLKTQITYYFGHVFRKPVLDNYPSYVGTYYGSIGKNKDFAKRWRKEGDETSTNVPGLPNMNYNSYSRYNYADINVLPAGNIRLQQVTLSYNLPNQWLEKLMIKNVSLSISARNLGLLWRQNKQGYDPQYLATSSYSTLTPARSYVFQLMANF